MAEEKKQSPPWKRPVSTLAPAWMSASVDRLEHERAETLDSARKKQKETPREGAEESQAAASSAAASSAAASGQATGSPSPVSLPPPVHDDMKNFKYVSLTPAAFTPTRHLFMCAGRPMVVPCFVYSPTPPTFVMPSRSHSPCISCCPSCFLLPYLMSSLSLPPEMTHACVCGHSFACECADPKPSM